VVAPGRAGGRRTRAGRAGAELGPAVALQALQEEAFAAIQEKERCLDRFAVVEAAKQRALQEADTMRRTHKEEVWELEKVGAAGRGRLGEGLVEVGRVV
jgi:hypothetical protein